MDTPLTEYEALAKRFEQIKGVRQPSRSSTGRRSHPPPSPPPRAGARRERGGHEAAHDHRHQHPGGDAGGDSTAGEGIAIGQRLADQLGVRVGDKLTLLSPNGPASPFGQTPRRKVYDVSAIFLIGMSEFDTAFVYMPLKEAQIYFDKDDEVSTIELTIDNPEQAERISQLAIDVAGRPVITERLEDPQPDVRRRAGGGAERDVHHPDAIVMVAALNIISGLIMLVRSKARDIAILRTMGAGRVPSCACS